MKTENINKINIQIASEDESETRSTRKTLKVIQKSAVDKENLVGRSKSSKTKLASSSNGGSLKAKKRVQLVHKSVQTGENVITAEDLTSDEPGLDYWKTLAEERKKALDESLEENGRLKNVVESLEEENKTCNEMLAEAKELVAVLQEMIQGEDEDDDNTEDLEVALR